MLDFPAWSNRSLLRACRQLPALRRAALANMQLPRSRVTKRRMLFLRRHAPRARIANTDEVASSLAAWAAQTGIEFLDVSFHAMAPHAQVELLLQTDILVSV
eukprot:561603-Prymnesium_polylepis.2